MHAAPPTEAAAPAPAAPSEADARSVTAGMRVRVLLLLGSALVVLLAAFTGLLALNGRQLREAEIVQTAASVETLLREQSLQQVQLMRGVSELLMDDPRLRQAFARRQRDLLLQQALPIFDSLRQKNRITHFYFILPDRTTLLRVHAPDHAGDRIERLVLLESERTGRPAWGQEQGPLGTFTLRVVHPWLEGGHLIGYLELGIEFEHMVHTIRDSLGADMFVAMDKRRFDQAHWTGLQTGRPHPVPWDEFPDVLLLGRTTAEMPPPLREFFAAHHPVPERHMFEITWDGRTAQAIAVPFTNLRGEAVGELVVVRETTAASRQSRSAMLTALMLGLGVGGGLMLLFYLLLGRVQRDMAARTERLKEAQRVLIVEQERNAAARQAGMAEVATNVLHNVGNILNSVNVSAELVDGTLRRSKVQGLVRAVELIDAHAADLPAFLQNDERGRLLPGYLRGVADALAQEQQRMLKELQHLGRSVQHIKDVVSTQQSYAAAASFTEPARATELVEEALRMDGGALERAGVEVVREFGEVPQARFDRARVLQILVNLVSNARHAMADVPPQDRRLVLRVQAEGERVRIAVRDSGEGIAAQNLTRIFVHGFTTRRSGHGFGLHSSAVAAREMGGTLTAHSDGPGHGATFTLELPLDAAKESP